MQNRVFDVVTTTFGYDATWTPSLGGSLVSGRVNYRRPNEKDILTNGMEYMPFVFFMEYRDGVFDGLQNAVRESKTTPEQVVIEGVSHYIRSIHRVYDGKTLQAHLERI